MSLYLVNFGLSKASLTTVGYALYDANGDLHTAHTTTGVTERPAGTGIYGADITLDDSWSGEIRWDTGETTPVYASETITYASFPDYGYGSVDYTYTVTVDGAVYSGAYVQFFTDPDKVTAPKVHGFTSADGTVLFKIDPGTYYIDVSLRNGTVYTDTEVVS